MNQKTAIYQCATIFTGILVVTNTYLLQNKKLAMLIKCYWLVLALVIPLYFIIGIDNTTIMKTTIASIVSLTITSFYQFT